MRLRTRLSDRYRADYKQAVGLLADNLVWSGDFESIRYDLMTLIDDHANRGVYPDSLTDIVQRLIATENDLSI